MSTHDTVTVKAVSYETVALQTPVPFVPPLEWLAGDPKAFDFWWRMLNFALALPSPYAFPGPFLEPNETLTRYCDAAKEMAESQFLAWDTRMTVSFEQSPDGQFHEEITSNFPTAEITRGFLVLFRQFFANDEEASFSRARGVLMSQAKTATDAEAEKRLDALKAWSRAQGRLRAYAVKTLVGQELVARGLWPASDLPDEGHPEQLFSVFAYGDQIHWGEGRVQLATWKADNFLGPYHQIRFFDIASGLANFYMGYAVLVARAIGRDDLSPPP